MISKLQVKTQVQKDKPRKDQAMTAKQELPRSVNRMDVARFLWEYNLPICIGSLRRTDYP